MKPTTSKENIHEKYSIHETNYQQDKIYMKPITSSKTRKRKYTLNQLLERENIQQARENIHETNY